MGQRYQAEVVRSSADEVEYKPIPPIYTSVNSNLLLIGLQSNSARPYWFLGASVSQYLYVSPSENPYFPSGVQVSEQKKLGLNRMTLVNFLDHNITPYLLVTEIPYWLQDIYLEIWEHSDGSNDSVEDALKALGARLDNVEAALTRIEYKLDNTSN
jgi:hypothetical protein